MKVTTVLSGQAKERIPEKAWRRRLESYASHKTIAGDARA